MKDQYGQFFQSTGAASLLPQLLLHTGSGAIVDVNPASEAFYGWPRVAMLAMVMSDLDTMSGESWDAHADASLRAEGRREPRIHRVAGGAQRHVEMCTTVVSVGDDQLLHVVVHEAARSGSHAVNGRDARRIVHDFNNLLTVLRGSAVFLQDAIAPTSQASDDLAAIERATDRAEELLNELLEVLPRA